LNFSPTLQKIISNLTWLSLDRIFRLFGAIFVNAMIIRYLGPENNGILNYAIAFAGMFSPLAVLGMDAIIIRDIIRYPSKKNEIIGSSFALRLIGGVSSLIFAATAIAIVRPDDEYTLVLVIIISGGMIFQSFDVIDYWFQSQVQSKYTVYAKNISFVIFSFAKIICIGLHAPIHVFVIITSCELVVAAIGLLYMYRITGNDIRSWIFSYKSAMGLLKNSWPIIISDLAIFIQSRVDQVMIGELLGNSQVGYYSAAQKVSEPLGFVPMIIMSSLYPVIVKTKEWSENEYYRRLTNLYRMLFILVILICTPISIFSDQIVSLLFGEDYGMSGTILAFLIWTRFYAFYGVARSIFISTENLFRHTLVCSIAGLIVSITANYFLIPSYGVYGAIAATHIGFIVTIFVIDGFSLRVRKNFIAMIQGIFTFYKISLKQ
jgi:O-antigen/teichoic acid export membrane protein